MAINLHEADITALLNTVASQLLAANQRVASAESCTGGWLAKAITDLDGSSQWFECSIVTYSNQTKQDFLGVSSESLEQYGAVSEAVVKEMVQGLLQRCMADIGVSISGVAGPGGGSLDKPVGTVWIAWAKNAQIKTTKFQFEGDRREVRLQAVYEALKGVEDLLE